MNAWAWIFALLFMVAVSCIEPRDQSLEPLPSLEPTPIATALAVATPTPKPTPEKSACEFEVDSLKYEVDSLRERLNNYSCECGEYDETL